MKHFNNISSGFTLVELLIVVALVAIIGLTTTQIFVMGIRSQGKSEVLKEVKQNGDYALSIIETMVRNAIDIPASCNTAYNQLQILNSDGLTTTFECLENGNISSISGLIVAPTPTGIPLTSNKVSVFNCSSAFRIVCPTPPLSPKYVYVNFSIRSSGSSLTPTPGSFSVLEYQTTVSLRNYK
jgi:prepilin-type N-terminal cleavage/methylation domain-containing protein